MSRKSISVRIYETNRDLTNYVKNINNSLVKNDITMIYFQTQHFTNINLRNNINSSLLKVSLLRRIKYFESFMPQDFTIKNEL